MNWISRLTGAADSAGAQRIQNGLALLRDRLLSDVGSKDNWRECLKLLISVCTDNANVDVPVEWLELLHAVHCGTHLTGGVGSVHAGPDGSKLGSSSSGTGNAGKDAPVAIDPELCKLSFDALQAMLTVRDSALAAGLHGGGGGGRGADSGGSGGGREGRSVLPSGVAAVVQFWVSRPELVGQVVTLVSRTTDSQLRFHGLRFLGALLALRGEKAQAALLAVPNGVLALVDVLGDANELVRNEALLICAEMGKDPTAKQIIAFNQGFDRLFEIVHSEDGGVIAENCISLINRLLVDHPANQSLFLDAGGLGRFLHLLERASPISAWSAHLTAASRAAAATSSAGGGAPPHPPPTASEIPPLLPTSTARLLLDTAEILSRPVPQSPAAAAGAGSGAGLGGAASTQQAAAAAAAAAERQGRLVALLPALLYLYLAGHPNAPRPDAPPADAGAAGAGSMGLAASLSSFSAAAASHPPAEPSWQDVPLPLRLSAGSTLLHIVSGHPGNQHVLLNVNVPVTAYLPQMAPHTFGLAQASAEDIGEALRASGGGRESDALAAFFPSSSSSSAGLGAGSSGGGGGGGGAGPDDAGPRSAVSSYVAAFVAAFRPKPSKPGTVAAPVPPGFTPLVPSAVALAQRALDSGLTLDAELSAALLGACLSGLQPAQLSIAAGLGAVIDIQQVAALPPLPRLRGAASSLGAIAGFPAAETAANGLPAQALFGYYLPRHELVATLIDDALNGKGAPVPLPAHHAASAAARSGPYGSGPGPSPSVSPAPFALAGSPVVYSAAAASAYAPHDAFLVSCERMARAARLLAHVLRGAPLVKRALLAAKPASAGGGAAAGGGRGPPGGMPGAAPTSGGPSFSSRFLTLAVSHLGFFLTGQATLQAITAFCGHSPSSLAQHIAAAAAYAALPMSSSRAPSAGVGRGAGGGGGSIGGGSSLGASGSLHGGDMKQAHGQGAGQAAGPGTRGFRADDEAWLDLSRPSVVRPAHAPSASLTSPTTSTFLGGYLSSSSTSFSGATTSFSPCNDHYTQDRPVGMAVVEEGVQAILLALFEWTRACPKAVDAVLSESKLLELLAGLVAAGSDSAAASTQQATGARGRAPQLQVTVASSGIAALVVASCLDVFVLASTSTAPSATSSAAARLSSGRAIATAGPAAAGSTATASWVPATRVQFESSPHLLFTLVNQRLGLDAIHDALDSLMRVEDVCLPTAALADSRLSRGAFSPRVRHALHALLPQGESPLHDRPMFRGPPSR